MRLILFLVLCCITSFTAKGQSSLSVSMPVIYSNVKVKDNWTPPTAPNYKEYLSGTAVGYGVNFIYSFRPFFLDKKTKFMLNAGLGYYNQRFDIHRPFNYDSYIYIIYYTDHYVYHNADISLSLTYKKSLNKNYSVNVQGTYHWLHSFKQDYTPTYSSPNRGFDGFTQTNYKSIDFGVMFNGSIELQRIISNKFCVGIGVVAPIIIRWRNDAIFNDNPNSFYKPQFSLGFNLSVSYRFQQKNTVNQ
ncbi:MAG: hypothetical protein JST69_13915 [Bacteroidetes bacterium]|nr:hypothetical protein [Bacteroidota bacterium]